MDKYIFIYTTAFVFLSLCLNDKNQASGTLLSSGKQGPWRLVFKAPSGTTHGSYSNLVSFYQASGSYNENDLSAMTDFSANSKLYKSSILDDWGTTRLITAVRWAVYKNGKEQKYVVFNGVGKSKTNFMDCTSTGVVESSYTDLTTENKEVCSFDGGGRNFFIQRNFGGCPNDAGWFMIKDYSASGGCNEWDPSSNMPYIKYAPGTTYTVWASSASTADSFAISVMEWFMVFKGVPGVTPADGSLESLYGSADPLDEGQSTYKTLTTSPSKNYKSGIVNEWTVSIIDQVQYAFFKSGEAKAWFVFNGRDSTSTSWFTHSNILDSSYTDYSTSKNVIGISGDTYRKFAIIEKKTSCSTFEAWMMVLDDPSGSTDCSFDSAATKPYFIYSALSTNTKPESGGSWDSTNFPAAEAMGIFIKGFFPVLKHAKSQSVSPASGLYNLWTGTYTLNEWKTDSFSKTSGSISYKSSLVDSWSSYYIYAVRLSFFVGGVEKAYVVFDATGTSDKTSWFDCDRLLYSSYSDLTRSSTVNYCSVDGASSAQRYFFIESFYNGCDNDHGWVGVMERASGCSWEYQTTKPYALFADQSTVTQNRLHAIADAFMISVAMDNMCGSAPCQNGGTCSERGVKFGCTCTSTYYGIVCQDRDGGFSDWSTWGSCSVTCTKGSQTRTRQCNNPTVVGDGVDCSGDLSETQSCNLVAICPVDGGWTVWTAWGACNVTCEDGGQSRTRTCTNPTPAGTGSDCVGDAQESQHCYPVICPVDGGWSDWTTWGTCSVSCDSGTKDRTRACDNPARVGAGLDCSGSASDSTSCYLEICPVDGGWSAWTAWEACSVTCDYGIQNRTRTCTNPTPVGRGLNCTGEPDDSQSCYPVICPVDGMWGDWAQWSDCSVTCESGINTRTRNCDNPAVVGAGLDCVGSGSDQRPCFVSEVCPVYYTGDLSDNHVLSVSCPANWTYYIYIVAAYYGNPSYSSLGSAVCQDTSATSKVNGWCHTKTDCTVTFSIANFGDPCLYTSTQYYTTYEQYSEAERYYQFPSYLYRKVYKSRSKQSARTIYHTRTKYAHLEYHCARDGQWNSWSEWTWCTKTCDTGTKTRNRTCNNPPMYSPGSDCVGDPTETIDCYTQLCPICGDHWSTYGDPAELDTFNDTYSGVMYMMADINWDIHCCEVLSAFEFLPVAAGDIYFQVWRKKGSGNYELVGETMVSINSTQVGVVYNHTLPLKSRINVQAQDEFGWYCAGENMIPYTNCSITVQLCPFENKRVNQSSKLNVGALFDWDGNAKVETLEGRGYAVKFYTHPNTAPYTNQSSYETLVKDHSPIGTSAIEYSIQDDDIGDVIVSSFSHSLFELNETFEWDIHIQTKSLLPKNYNVYQCILVSHDTCQHTTTTTIQITTYNAPPYYLNLPDKIEMKEDVVTRQKLITMDVIDRSENDSICCTLARVEPASLNFELVFENNLYHLYTISSPVFNYKEISNYYKLRVCCSDTYGTSMSFLEIDIVDVIIPTAYVPPTWFLTAVAISMVPICITFLFACSMLCITMFCDADIRYVIIYE